MKASERTIELFDMLRFGRPGANEPHDLFAFARHAEELAAEPLCKEASGICIHSNEYLIRLSLADQMSEAVALQSVLKSSSHSIGMPAQGEVERLVLL